MLAAFLAGIIVGGLISRGAPTSGRIEATGFGFLIPMFFFSVGVGFDLRALLSSQATRLAMPALIALAYRTRSSRCCPCDAISPGAMWWARAC